MGENLYLCQYFFTFKLKTMKENTRYASYILAETLKEAGFPQPLPSVGQHWYGLSSDVYGCELRAVVKDEGILGVVDYLGNYHTAEHLKRWGIFAPSFDDLFSELQKQAKENTWWSLFFSRGEINEWQCRFHYKDAHETFYGDTPLMAAAKAYLNSVWVE